MSDGVYGGISSSMERTLIESQIFFRKKENVECMDAYASYRGGIRDIRTYGRGDRLTLKIEFSFDSSQHFSLAIGERITMWTLSLTQSG